MTPRATPLRFLRRSWDTVVVALAVATLLAMSISLSRIAGWIPRLVLAITFALVVLQLGHRVSRTRAGAGWDAAGSSRPMRPAARWWSCCGSQA